MKQALRIEPAKAALLFVDLQEEHRHDVRYLVDGFDQVLANAGQLQMEAQRREIPVFHCAYIVDMAETRPFHPIDKDGASAFSDKDSPWTAICPEVSPADSEPLLVKADASAFADGKLERQLRSRGVEWLFVAGVWSEACVDASVKDAVKLGFHVALVKDACGSGTTAMHQVAILNLANRLYGGTVVDTSNARSLMMGMAVKAWQPDAPVPIRYTAETISSLYDAL